MLMKKKDEWYYQIGKTDQRGLDCLVNSVNYIIRHPLFTRREQVIRLMAKNQYCTLYNAIDMKKKSGLKFSHFRDFMVCDGYSYSLNEEPVRTINRQDFTLNGASASLAVYEAIRYHMVTREDPYDELILIFHGVNETQFYHSAAFIVIPIKGKREVYLLDCKNEVELNCMYNSEPSDTAMYPVEHWKDIEDVYFYRWDLICLEKRYVNL